MRLTLDCLVCSSAKYDRQQGKGGNHGEMRRKHQIRRASCFFFLFPRLPPFVSFFHWTAARHHSCGKRGMRIDRSAIALLRCWRSTTRQGGERERERGRSSKERDKVYQTFRDIIIIFQTPPLTPASVPPPAALCASPRASLPLLSPAPRPMPPLARASSKRKTRVILPLY